jgi:hypothetical protein
MDWNKSGEKRGERDHIFNWPAIDPRDALGLRYQAKRWIMTTFLAIVAALVVLPVSPVVVGVVAGALAIVRWMR